MKFCLNIYGYAQRKVIDFFKWFYLESDKKDEYVNPKVSKSMKNSSIKLTLNLPTAHFAV